LAIRLAASLLPRLFSLLCATGNTNASFPYRHPTLEDIARRVRPVKLWCGTDVPAPKTRIVHNRTPLPGRNPRKIQNCKETKNKYSIILIIATYTLSLEKMKKICYLQNTQFVCTDIATVK